MIELPTIEWGRVLPVAGLALIAVVCIMALLVRSVLHSRVALLIAVVGGVVIAGPTLALALAQVVGALVPLAIVAVVGGVSVLWMVQRNPVLLDMARDVVPRKQSSPPALPPFGEEGSSVVVIDQPKATTARLPARRVTIVNQDTDRWGF